MTATFQIVHEADVQALLVQAFSLHQQGRLTDAEAPYRAILELQADHFDALHLLGVLKSQQGENAEALRLILRALEQQPGSSTALSNLGMVLGNLGRPAEAIETYDKALAIRPDYPKALHNRANALAELLRPREALEYYDKALALVPDDAETRFSRGLTALLLGDFSGFDGYQARFEQPEWPKLRALASVPAWSGEPVTGKRILVIEEQGLGDLIQFSRYLAELCALGAHVTCAVQPKLHRLLGTLGAPVRLVGKLPRDEAFDYQTTIMSLPAAFKTTPGTIPDRVPYLAAEPGLIDAWRPRIGNHGLKIGIAWQGNPSAPIDKGRSFPVACFAPLARIPGVRLISLQKVHGLEQLKALPPGMTVETLDADFDSGPDAFIDAAAVMSCLDLIITSDTSIAHLAGALGRPVWLVLKQVPDWRWMIERPDSPWYPTMRLYRQTDRGDWDGVFARIAADLVHFKAAPALAIPGSVGELFDKITILEIKAQRIGDPAKLANVAHELGLLRALAGARDSTSAEAARLIGELKRANEALWEIEDDIRDCERQGDFGARFIALARAVYMTNDRRAALKKELSVLAGSSIVEEKSYRPTQ